MAWAIDGTPLYPPLEEETHTAINQPFTYHAKSAYYELW